MFSFGGAVMKRKPQILLVDMQSFYANIEKSYRPELRDQPVVVSGDPKRRSGVILAACPIAKSYGIKNAITLWEAQQRCPQLVVVRPRMQLYIETSIKLTEILEQFSDQVEPYSIDEQFIDVTGSQRLFGPAPVIAQKIQQTIDEELGLPARVGIGSNKVLAKMACDQFAKKNSTGIFYLPVENVPTQLWPLAVGKLFGVGSRMSRHFQRMGIQTIGELAQFPLAQLKTQFGINGHVLWMTANGRDHSPVTQHTFHTPKGIGHQMTLPFDYRTRDEIEVVLLELSEEVCRRSRQHQLAGKTVTVHCRTHDLKHGFSRQISTHTATNHTLAVFQLAQTCFFHHWQKDPIRSLGLRLSKFDSDTHTQLSLFENTHAQHQIGHVMDEIKLRFGQTAIMRAVSLLPAGQAYARAQKIGGHAK